MQKAYCHDSCGRCPNNKPYIETSNGRHYINDTDMIITGAKGEDILVEKIYSI